MKSLISVLIFCALLTTGVASNYVNSGAREVALDDFISSQIEILRNSLKDPVFQAPSRDFYFNTSSSWADISLRNTTLGDIKSFNDAIASSVGQRTISFQLSFAIQDVEGNYTLDGMSGSVIVVKGAGEYNVQVEGDILWLGEGSFEVDSEGYAFINSLNFSATTLPSVVNATFCGIEGEVIIGDLIKEYKEWLGGKLHEEINNEAMNYIANILWPFLNSAFQTKTLEEILEGNNPSTTTATPTTVVTTTDNTRPDIIVDIGSDLAGSGWEVLASSTCSYSNLIQGFYCNGDNVEISDPTTPNRGFWMSPCDGKCVFSFQAFGPERQLVVYPYYNDAQATVKVNVTDSSGITELTFSEASGSLIDINLGNFNDLTEITLSMENTGLGHFSILDRIEVSY